MKNIFLNRVPVAVAALFMFIVTFSSCSKDKDNTPQVPPAKVAALKFSGANEVPANPSTGTGTGKVSFDPTAKTISFSVSWKLGDPAATTSDMHFHGSETGTDASNSPVVIKLDGFSKGNSGDFTAVTRALTDVEVSQLLAGKWYMNIHSTTVPGGEMRANIKF